ncbi:MAG: hypothetical protein RI580_07205 [Halothece sp. Uz-M2-17]|nr:hypothetical protein [Halothece sp. Uz-M2-17]
MKLWVRSRWILFLLTVGAIAGNYFNLPLFFRVDLLFGTIFALTVVKLYGIGWGTLVGLLAGSYTLHLWSHPYAKLLVSSRNHGFKTPPFMGFCVKITIKLKKTYCM